MALTVNSKPSGFRPVGGGELMYQFTEASVSGKPNYRVEIELSGLTVPIFEYRPNASLVIQADIAPMLRAALSLDFTTGSRFNNTYVKYQAKWDGGSDSQVSLTGDVIYFYAGVETDLNKRTIYHIGPSNNGPLLNHGETIYCWAGRTSYMDFLYSGLDADTDVYYNSTLVLTFDGSGIGMKSISFDPDEDGTIFLKSALDNTVYRVFNIKILPECLNPVYLKWINDYGGISTWLFSYNQLYSLSPQLLWRDKTLTVETNILSFQQWQMLQELNKDGIEYGDNEKSGAYVVDFTDEAYPVNVFCLPENADTMTKMAKHNFTLSFRYAQLPNILL